MGYKKLKQFRKWSKEDKEAELFYWQKIREKTEERFFNKNVSWLRRVLMTYCRPLRDYWRYEVGSIEGDFTKLVLTKRGKLVAKSYEH